MAWFYDMGRKDLILIRKKMRVIELGMWKYFWLV